MSPKTSSHLHRKKDAYVRKNQILSMPRVGEFFSFRALTSLVSIIGAVMILAFWTEDSLYPWVTSALLTALAILYHPHMEWTENYVYNGLLALYLIFILFYFIAKDKLRFDLNLYIAAAFILAVVITGFLLPLNRFFRTKRNIRLHNERVREAQIMDN